MTRAVGAGLALLALLATDPAYAVPGQPTEVVVRGKSLTLTLYAPSGTAHVKGTVIMGSGDVGWVGLAVTLAGFLSDQGYNVVGVNVRQYLGSFTSGTEHVTVSQIPGDYAVIADFLRARHVLTPPVVLAGVSEGAAVAVAAAAGRSTHAWAHGVLTLGLPPSAELAWRWTDFTAWISKKDADEPSFEPDDVIGNIAPLPLWMIQSTKDEYVKEADYRRFYRAAKEPRRLTLIDASNHRFTDRIPQLKDQVLAGLTWIAASRAAPR